MGRNNKNGTKDTNGAHDTINTTGTHLDIISTNSKNGTNLDTYGTNSTSDTNGTKNTNGGGTNKCRGTNVGGRIYSFGGISPKIPLHLV